MIPHVEVAMVDEGERKGNPSKGILRDNTVPLSQSRRRVSFAPEVTLHKFQNVKFPSSKRRRTIGFEYSSSQEDSAVDSTDGPVLDGGAEVEIAASTVSSVQPPTEIDHGVTRELLVDSSDLDESDNGPEPGEANLADNHMEDDEQPMDLTDQIRFIHNQFPAHFDIQHILEHQDDQEQTMELTGQIPLVLFLAYRQEQVQVETHQVQSVEENQVEKQPQEQPQEHVSEHIDREEEQEDDEEQTMEFTGQINTANIIIPVPHLKEIKEESDHQSSDENSEAARGEIPGKLPPTAEELDPSHPIYPDEPIESVVEVEESTTDQHTGEPEPVPELTSSEADNEVEMESAVDIEHSELVNYSNRLEFVGTINEEGQITMDITQTTSKTRRFSVTGSTKSNSILSMEHAVDSEHFAQEQRNDTINDDANKTAQTNELEVTMDLTFQKPLQQSQVLQIGESTMDITLSEPYKLIFVTETDENSQNEVHDSHVHQPDIAVEGTDDTNHESLAKPVDDLLDPTHSTPNINVQTENSPGNEPIVDSFPLTTSHDYERADEEFEGSQPMELTQEGHTDTVDTFGGNELSLNDIKEVVSTSKIPLAGVYQDNENDEDDYSPVTLKEFMNDIHVNFYDDLDMGNNYRSSFSALNTKNNFELQDYITALPKLELLALYEFSCEELKKNIEEGRKVFAEYNNTIEVNNPPLFREYYASDNETRINMNLKLQQLKDYSRFQSRKTWYVWRTQLTENLVYELDVKKENLLQDIENMNKNIVKLDELCLVSREKFDELKSKLASLRHFKQQLSDLSEEEINQLRKNLSDTREEILSTRKEIETNEKQLQYLISQISEKRDKQEQLKSQIAACNDILNMNRSYESDEILLISLKFKILQRYSKMKFIRVEGKKMIFEFDGTFGVEFNFEDIANPENLKITYKADSQIGNSEESSYQSYELRNKFLLSHIVPLIENVQATNNIMEKFAVFAQAWNQLKQLDMDIFKISLNCPVSWDLQNSVLLFSFLYCNFGKGYKLSINCELNIDHLLEYSNNIAITFQILRGTSVSKSSIEADLNNELPANGIFTERSMQQLTLQNEIV